MVKFVALAALAALAAAQTEIVNGTEAPVGKYLYVTGLRQNETSEANCGASLIAPKILLTAAHCVETAWAKFASIGSHFTAGDKDGERIKIAKRTRHPKYKKATEHDYDFAILELEKESSFPPVKIHWDQDASVAPGVVTWVRGFGRIKTGGPQPDVLLETDVTIVSNADCQKALTGRGTITSAMLCAGGGFKDTCQGDSGGPLTVIKNGEEYLAGVTSWGIGCATPGLPGMYARISEARDFIEPFLTTTIKPGC